HLKPGHLSSSAMKFGCGRSRPKVPGTACGARSKPLAAPPQQSPGDCVGRSLDALTGADGVVVRGSDCSDSEAPRRHGDCGRHMATFPSSRQWSLAEVGKERVP